MSASDKPAEGSPSPPQKKEPTPVDKSGTVPAPAVVAAQPPLTVTQATHNDIADICTLYKKVWDEFRGKAPQELERSWQPSPLEFTSLMEGVTFFAARKDKKLVGILGCSMVDGSTRLVHVAVDKDFRRQGIGVALVNSGIDWAKRGSSSSIWVEALTRFQDGIKLLRKLGFKETGMFHKHLWKEDVILMEIVF
jgi:GNAT superfamily N-acetyltransferase